MERWVSKDPQDQPTLQFQQAGEGTEMEGRQASSQGHTAGQRQCPPRVPHHLPHNWLPFTAGLKTPSADS